MLKYWIFTCKVTVGERSFIVKRAVELPPTVKIEDYVNKAFLANYFGTGTKRDEDNIFWSPDGGAAVKFSSAQEISLEHYIVLKKYL